MHIHVHVCTLMALAALHTVCSHTCYVWKWQSKFRTCIYGLQEAASCLASDPAQEVVHPCMYVPSVNEFQFPPPTTFLRLILKTEVVSLHTRLSLHLFYVGLKVIMCNVNMHGEDSRDVLQEITITCVANHSGLHVRYTLNMYMYNVRYMYMYI